MVTQSIPRWARKFIGESGLDVVEEAISQAEAQTAGEVVVAVASRSSATGHVAFLIGLVLGIVIVDLAWMLDAGSSLVACGLVIAAVAAVGLARIPWVQRLCTLSQDRDRQVHNAAAAEFLRARISNTRAATGVLIYVSLMEHEVVVLGDSAIAAKLDQSQWDSMVSAILSGIKRGDFAGGIKSGVEIAGELLALHFPVSPGDRNELHNALRFID